MIFATNVKYIKYIHDSWFTCTKHDPYVTLYSHRERKLCNRLYDKWKQTNLYLHQNSLSCSHANWLVVPKSTCYTKINSFCQNKTQLQEEKIY